MRVLALGNSDSLGQYITGPTWSEVARIRLERHLGEPVQFESVAYSPIGPTALPFAERKIREATPDVIVLLIGSYPFTAGFTWVRVASLFGERAGRWYRRIEERFEKETRGKGWLRNHLNRTARKVVPRVVGTKPMTNREHLTNAYREIFRSLSRHEETGVVLVTYPGLGAHARSKKAIRERAIFFPEVRALAHAHRFAWVDGEQLFSQGGAADVIHPGDGLHFNDLGHQVLGEAVARAIQQQPAMTGGEGARHEPAR